MFTLLYLSRPTTILYNPVPMLDKRQYHSIWWDNSTIHKSRSRKLYHSKHHLHRCRLTTCSTKQPCSNSTKCEQDLYPISAGKKDIFVIKCSGTSRLSSLQPFNEPPGLTDQPDHNILDILVNYHQIFILESHAIVFGLIFATRVDMFNLYTFVLSWSYCTMKMIPWHKV